MRLGSFRCPPLNNYADVFSLEYQPKGAVAEYLPNDFFIACVIYCETSRSFLLLSADQHEQLGRRLSAK